MSAYLTRKYGGNKQISADKGKIIQSAIQAYQASDIDVNLFAKILDHKVDDKFWHRQKQVKSTVLELYQGYARETTELALIR
jgi:phosphate uptake regulator